jgi:hypothetical protein
MVTTQRFSGSSIAYREETGGRLWPQSEDSDMTGCTVVLPPRPPSLEVPGKRRTAAICPLEPPHSKQSPTNAKAVEVTAKVEEEEEAAKGMNLQRSFTAKRSKIRTWEKK